MITHLTAENQAILENMRNKMSYANKPMGYDHFGLFDVFKSKKNRHKTVCGEQPKQEAFESDEEYQEELDVYNTCIKEQEARFSTEIKEKSDNIGNTVGNATSVVDSLLSSFQRGKNRPSKGGFSFNRNNTSNEKVWGMPPALAYSILAIVIILLIILIVRALR